MSVSRVLVVGGGITGGVLALALARRGVAVELAEIRPGWTALGHGITLQGNALAAFREVGVYDAIAARGVAFDRLRMRRADGSLLVEVPTPHTGGPDLPPTVGSLRSSVHDALADAVRAHGVALRLGTTVESFDDDGQRVAVTFTDGSEGEYDLVVGADGIRSQMRRMLGIVTEPRSVGMTIWRVLAERPAAMDCAEVYYGGPRYKAGYSPISADQCYAYVLDEDVDTFSFDKPLGAVLRERSEGYGGIWGEIRGRINDETEVNHTRIEALLVADPWYRGRVIVIGDAAHACPPLIAQGAAMCAEDAIVLAELVTGDTELEDALKQFMARRLPRVRAVVENSMLLVDWEIHPDTPGADPARIMSSTLSLLTEPA
jgi:2-polyprenyl-6-methoxyphenol hydroxylase-like FAD-dependent oxidoreductase